jgi:hypothetical protein
MQLTKQQLKKLILEEIEDLDEQQPQAWQAKTDRYERTSPQGTAQRTKRLHRGAYHTADPAAPVEMASKYKSGRVEKGGRPVRTVSDVSSQQSPGAEKKLEFVPWEGEATTDIPPEEYRKMVPKGKKRYLPSRHTTSIKQAPQTRYGQLDPTRAVSESNLKKIIAEEITNLLNEVIPGTPVPDGTKCCTTQYDTQGAIHPKVFKGRCANLTGWREIGYDTSTLRCRPSPNHTPGPA